MLLYNIYYTSLTYVSFSLVILPSNHHASTRRHYAHAPSNLWPSRGRPHHSNQYASQQIPALITGTRARTGRCTDYTTILSWNSQNSLIFIYIVSTFYKLMLQSYCTKTFNSPLSPSMLLLSIDSFKNHLTADPPRRIPGPAVQLYPKRRILEGPRGG